MVILKMFSDILIYSLYIYKLICKFNSSLNQAKLFNPQQYLPTPFLLHISPNSPCSECSPHEMPTELPVNSPRNNYL